jgi:hypothetical protein
MNRNLWLLLVLLLTSFNLVEAQQPKKVSRIVQQATKFEFVINPITAWQIDFTIPSSMLAQANRVTRGVYLLPEKNLREAFRETALLPEVELAPLKAVR